MSSLNALQLLLKAPSKKIVDGIFVGVFRSRESPINQTQINDVVQVLSCSDEEAKELLVAVRTFIKDCIYEAPSPKEMLTMLPAKLHDQLKKLLATIVHAHLREWRQDAVFSHPALPRLQEIDWRIDVKSASESITQMSVPTVLVELKVDDNTKNDEDEERARSVLFELNKETLQTMLSGLGTIREQLSSVVS